MIKKEKLTSQFVREESIAFSCRHNAGHLAPSLSSVEILTTLFREFLHFNVENPQDSSRDRLVFSKGHGCYAYYVILNALGFIPDDVFHSFSAESSVLKGCVSYTPEFMLEASTGSLGHGLPIAVGMAQSLKMQGKNNKVVCIIGDGEMQEGSNFEALASAYRFKLDNLLIIIDANDLSAMDRLEHIGLPNDTLSRVLRAYVDEECFYDIDGHNENALREAYRHFFDDAKGLSIIVARTIKGKGVAMIESNAKYHYRCPLQDGFVWQDKAMDISRASIAQQEKSHTTQTSTPTWIEAHTPTNAKQNATISGPQTLANKKQIMDALYPYFANDEKMVLLVGDMGFAVLDSYFEHFSYRVFNVGIAEQAMVGMAAGMYLSGLKPVVYAQIPFLSMRAYEQIRYDVCEHYLGVIIRGVGADNYFKALGRSHCMDSDDIKLMEILPQLQIVSLDENGVKMALERYFSAKNLSSPPPRCISGAYNARVFNNAKKSAALRAANEFAYINSFADLSVGLSVEVAYA